MNQNVKKFIKISFENKFYENIEIIKKFFKFL